MQKSNVSILKKLIGKIHLWGGLVSGIVVFIVSITGCLFVFEQEIREFTQKEYRFVVPENSPKASLSLITLNLAKAFPDKKIEQVRFFSDPSRAVIAKLVASKSTQKAKKEEEESYKEAYFLHPNSGELISKKDFEHDFMHTIQEIHTSLLLGETGKWIIKANVVIFLIMLLSGLYMWWPSKKNQRKMAFRLNLKGKTQIVNYSIHNVLGFYFLLPLILISLTGIWWAIKPVQKLTYATLGEKMKEKVKVSSNFQAGKIFSPQSAFEAVSTTYAGWKEAHITFPQKSKDCIRVNLKYPYEVYKKNNLFEFDQYSGKILRSELFADYKTVDKIKHANRDLHTGQNYGIIGKLIAFFSSLFAASLPITGFLIWYFKKFKKTTKNKIVRKTKHVEFA